MSRQIFPGAPFPGTSFSYLAAKPQHQRSPFLLFCIWATFVNNDPIKEFIHASAKYSEKTFASASSDGAKSGSAAC